MRRTAALAIVALSAATLGVTAPHIYPAAQAATTSTTDAPRRSITVTADGQTQIAPDVAYVSVGVQQTDLAATKAQSQTNRLISAALAKIKAAGIPDRDIQTSGISLQPQYDDRGTLTGFQATDTLSITVEQIGQAGAVIDAGVSAGANYNVSVSFGLKNSGQAQTAALKAAVSAAQSKAAAVAAQLGVSLQGATFQVVENNNSPIPYAAQAKTLSAARDTSTPVQTGTLTVSDNVTVTYTL